MLYSVVTIVTPVGEGDAAPTIEPPSKAIMVETIVDPDGKPDEQVIKAIVGPACMANAAKVAQKLHEKLYPRPADQFPEISDVLPAVDKMQ